MITAHSGSRDVRTWSTLQGALSDKPLSPKLETIVVTVCLWKFGHLPKQRRVLKLQLLLGLDVRQYLK